MKSFKDLSLRYKLILVSTLVSGFAIIIAAIALVYYDQYSFKESTINDMEVLADVIAINCTTSLMFDDEVDAHNVLEALSAHPHVEEALLFNADSLLFASYQKDVSSSDSHQNISTSIDIIDDKYQNYMSIERSIIFESDQIGSIRLLISKEGLYARLNDFSSTAFIIILVVMILLFLIVSRLEHLVTDPIVDLARMAKSVSIHHNYDLRVKRLGNDEVGFLVDTFNDMLAKLGNHEKELQKSNDELEQRVHERTKDLEEQIDHRVEAEKTLAKSESRFRAMIEKSSDIIIVVGIDCIVKYVSPSVASVFDIEPKDVIGSSINPFIHPADINEVMKQFHKISKIPGATISIECRYRDSKLEWRNIEAYMSNLFEECGGIVINARDITDRKKAENTIRESLNEKEVLLKEIHHRVKNNLQVICSLLNLQRSNQTEDFIISILQDSEHRVKSMALIHEKLYRSHDLANIDIADYTSNLVKVLFRSFQGSLSNIHLKIEIDKYFLGVDQAVPLGLIVNELVSNALKHAFTEQSSGELIVGSLFISESEYAIYVSDDGKGLPDNLDELKNKSLGLQLVYTLVNQLGGTVSIKSENGTRWEIQFPVNANNSKVNLNEKDKNPCC